jgi:hypothetical protein
MTKLASSKSLPPERATEERLDEIRRTATPGPVLVEPRVSEGNESYYGLPLLKSPTWTWQVPLYFFLGGIAGVAANIAFIAECLRAHVELVRPALWIAFIAAMLCPPLLVADLGKPMRFLNMLRVFKWRSVMSVGAWTLTAFSGFAAFALLGYELIVRDFQNQAIVPVQWLAAALAALTGLILASYTGVLLGVTAVPVWSENRRLLPAHFLTSALGSVSGLLELLGYLVPATQILGFATSGIETVIDVFLEFRRRPVDAPLLHGNSGRLLRLAGLFEGPLSLLVRLLLGSTSTGRWIAAIFFIGGALTSRYAWIAAGRSSTHDPEALFALQRTKDK